jgi:hypothetical protein
LLGGEIITTPNFLEKFEIFDKEKKRSKNILIAKAAQTSSISSTSSLLLASSSSFDKKKGRPKKMKRFKPEEGETIINFANEQAENYSFELEDEVDQLIEESVLIKFENDMEEAEKTNSENEEENSMDDDFDAEKQDFNSEEEIESENEDLIDFSNISRFSSRIIIKSKKFSEWKKSIDDLNQLENTLGTEKIKRRRKK